MRILGIDGGYHGGLTLIENGKILFKSVMPIIEIKKAKGKKHDYDEVNIYRFMQEHKPDIAVLEKAQSMPDMAAQAVFNTGQCYGFFKGLFVGMQIPYTIVHSKTWQTVMFRDMPKEDTKAMSAIVCGRLFPTEDFRATERCKNIHDGLTDSTLIALWYERVMLGQISRSISAATETPVTAVAVKNNIVSIEIGDI